MGQTAGPNTYFFNENPSVHRHEYASEEGMICSSDFLSYPMSIDVGRTDGLEITKVGLKGNMTVIHDNDGRLRILDGSCGIPSNIGQWDEKVLYLIENMLEYPRSELEQIKSVFMEYVTERKIHA
jgi:hypothetical protein